MAWRALTEADLLATLSRAEVDAFRLSIPASGVEPVADLLSRTAEFVRGYCRANRALSVDETAGYVPAALVNPACEIAAFELLKRMDKEVNEDRKSAWEKALETLEAVANGKLAVEPATDPEESGDAMPAFADAVPPRVLD